MALGEPTGRRAPTLEDVAKVAGVSRATVSRVVNNTRNVDPALHTVVWDAVAATGYVPNRAARSLVTRRTDVVALVVSEAENRASDDPFYSRFLGDPFFGRVLGGALSVLAPLGVHVPLTLVGSAAARRKLIADLRGGQLDGALVISLHPQDPLPRQLAEAKAPAVLFGRPSTPTAIDYVDVDQAGAAKLAAEHLLSRGCKRVVSVAGSLDMPAGHDRLTAFRAALADHGITDVPAEEGGFTQEGGERAMLRLLKKHPKLDGVYAASDVMAQGALHVLREAGKRVPEDVAVVGFDDSSAASSCRPPLTTVRQPVEDMTAEMARMLMFHLEHPAARTTSVVFEPTLVVRQSA
ncbi:MAG: LacI family DNA-binding transcriptional regulator [Hamadaea sp.]|nr:LacI family DNA-binding transcriptional regulator [Hamadaea sp.]NUR98140.1 LacI family DNA-binding transcriptional regulator [Kribbellaceae bacterium]NUT04221.1 LacI family DNA-binding transcriptional regulator [Hamadaea sp.]